MISSLYSYGSVNRNRHSSGFACTASVPVVLLPVLLFVLLPSSLSPDGVAVIRDVIVGVATITEIRMDHLKRHRLQSINSYTRA